MNYKILDSESDRSSWSKVLSLFPDELQDIYFYPDYVGMHKFNQRTKSLMFTCEEKGNIWVHPFLLQSINLDELSFSDDPWFDIQSAYGYGGPLSNTCDQTFLDKANEQFSEWCRGNNVIAEFLRFHPIIENEKWVSKSYYIEKQRDTLSIKPLHDEQQYLNPKVRNKIRRLNKLNIEINKVNIEKYFQPFVDIYHKNMKRLNADKYYYFSTNYFTDLKDLTYKSGYLVGATEQEKLIGASIFLFGKKNLHYHLSATEYQCAPGLSNSLIDAGLQICKKEALNMLHLGGGSSNSSSNNLYRFKKSMGNIEHLFSIGWKIHHPEIYNKIKKIFAVKFRDSFQKHGNKILFYRFK